MADYKVRNGICQTITDYAIDYGYKALDERPLELLMRAPNFNAHYTKPGSSEKSVQQHYNEIIKQQMASNTLQAQQAAIARLLRTVERAQATATQKAYEQEVQRLKASR
jgi:hypothetical protein